MGSASSNIANIQQSFINNITQVDQQNCIATVSSSANNNVVIINGANISGNFTGIADTTKTDASCLMVSSMENSISNILNATLQQTNTAETDWFNGFQFTSDTNSFNIVQSVTNNINQINEATCSASTIQSANNNYVYVTDATIGGNFVGVTESTSANANCSMTNIIKNSTYNQVQANATQSNVIKGMFVAMIGAFAVIFVIIAIGVVVLYSRGTKGNVGYKAGTQKRSGVTPKVTRVR